MFDMIVYSIAGNVIHQFSTSTGTVPKEVGMSSQGTVNGISLDGDGVVYAAMTQDGTGSIYRIDFSGNGTNKTKINVGNLPPINDITVDRNKNVMITSVNSLYQLASADSYNFSKASMLAKDDAGSILYVTSDANGGIYYSRTAGVNKEIRYLRPDYTHTYLKNKYIEQTVATLKDIKGLDVGAQYDMVIADSNAKQITGFVGSRSDPSKKDSDNDGRYDGYGNTLEDADGELDCNFTFFVNNVSGSSTPLKPRPTFPTIADSDGDGASDGAEVTPCSLNVLTLSAPYQDTIDYIISDPTRPDTDSDGLSDGLERLFTDPCSRDTDQDGIQDATEDANHNGRRDWGETCAVISDSDWDCLADGWKDYGADFAFDTHDAGEMDGIRQSYETLGEDLNFSGKNDPLEPSPLKADSDGDGVEDHAEVYYLHDHGYPTNHDADSDGVPDVLEKDADADGLSDSRENRNLDATLDDDESDPYDCDTDNDKVPDGVEPSPFNNIDGDSLDNAQDSDSNGDGILDGNQTFVLFRTTARDANGDGMLEFVPGAFVATHEISNPDVVNLNTTALTRYAYESLASSLPSGSEPITVKINSQNPIELKTPDGRAVYIKTGTTNHIYIDAGAGDYYEYQEVSGAGSFCSPHVYWINGHSNEVSLHQIVMDTRLATSDDADFDGLKGTGDHDPCSYDRDTDDDGIIDGMDPDPADHDNDAYRNAPYYKPGTPP